MRKNIPNIITLLNLCAGILAIYHIFLEDWMTVAWLFGLAGFADFADGLVARALRVSSPLGKELDSLADMVSFGVVPGLVIFKLLLSNEGSLLLALPALIVPIASCLRLARFNTEDDPAGDFVGMSTPSATALVIGLVLVIEKSEWIQIGDMLSQSATLYIVSVVLALLMTSSLKMFSLKFKGMQWEGNQIRLIFIFLFVAFSVVWQWSSVFMIMALYILVALIQNWFFKTA